MSRKQQIDALVQSLNKEMGNRIVIQRGSEIGWLSARRLHTGSLGLDIAMNGGIPCGMVTQFMGEEACESEDTFIPYGNKTPDGKMQNCKGGTIARLYERFHRLRVPGKGKTKTASADTEFFVASVNEDDRIFWNRIVDVVDSGMRLCFEVETSRGHRITATEDHRFYRGGYYSPLSELAVGDVVAVHENVPFIRERGLLVPSRKHVYVRHHPVAGVKEVTGGYEDGRRYRYHTLLRARAVVEAAMNGLPFGEFISRLQEGDLDGLRFLPRETHVHHLDEDVRNDAESNLMVIDGSAHNRMHALVRHNDLRFMAVSDRVVSVRRVGLRHTYDVKMASPFNNYVANKFVVHNSGKTTMALKCAGMLQDALEDEAAIAFIAVEPFDKRWANQCGCAIPFTKAELALMSDDDREVYEEIVSVGSFVVGQATTGEDALELALKFIGSHEFQLVIVDSMAALVPAQEEEKEMAENTMGQLPRLIGKFLRKCYAAFNTQGDDGEPNQTAVLLINQVREVIGTYGHPEPQAPGGRGLRHALACNVRFKRGELLKDGEKGAALIYGKRTKIRVEKNKVGPPFREAEFDFYFQPFGTFQPGDIDTVQEIRRWGVQAGLIQQTGNSSYAYDGQKFKGKDAVEHWLRDHEDVCADLAQGILAQLTTSVGR